jgi:hypothetical protein
VGERGKILQFITTLKASTAAFTSITFLLSFLRFVNFYLIFYPLFSSFRASVDRFSEKEFEENFLRVVCPIFE